MDKQFFDTLDLKTFLNLYTFKDVVVNQKLDGIPKQEDKTIRVYFDLDNPQKWFEIGVSDFIKKNNMLDNIISKDILNMVVLGFYVHDNKLCVTVSGINSKKKITNLFNDSNFGNPEA